MFGFADRRERAAKLGGTFLRQVAALDDGETGGVDVGIIDRVGRKTGERGIGLDCLVDLSPDGVFADAEQNMHAVIGGISPSFSARKSSRMSLVDLPTIASAVIRTAMPPKPSGRIFEQVKDVTAVT